MYKTIQVGYLLDQKVLHLRLNRPKVHNALNPEMIDELIKALEQGQSNHELRGAILSGNGASFCAGADIHWMEASAHEDYDASFANSRKLARLFNAIYAYRIPVIAVVHNNVYGGGLGLMAACDVVYAETDSQFRFSEVRLGIIPATIMPYILKKIPMSVAKVKVYTAERFNAFEALRIGIVDEVKKSGEGLDSAIMFMKEVIKGSPGGVNLSKKLINQLSETSAHETVMERTCQLLVSAKQTDDASEGLQAFLDKRIPKWSGH